jgi:predicted TIM-barrel fold metal-dependent hydrolase
MHDHSWSRREFLSRGSFAPLFLTGFNASEGAAPSPIVDTHVHCFAGSKDRRFPYHARAPYRPEEPATPEFLLTCMKGAGVDYAVIVHPEPYQDDHRYLEYCLSRDSKKLRGTCLFFADRPGSVEKMKALAGRCAIKTLRIHAYAPERLPPFGKPELRTLWKAAVDLGLMIQLHFEPRYAGGFEPLIREFKKTPVLIDHLGRPFQGTPREHERIIRWGKLPNTILKVSAVPPTRSYPHRDIRPILNNLTCAYGPERMIYGGGFGAGVRPQEYRATRERIASLLAGLSAADRARVLGGNAFTLFGFGS